MKKNADRILNISIWLLSGLLMVALLSFLPVGRNRLLQAQVPPATIANTGIYHFKIGQWQGMSVSDGNLSFPPSLLVPNAQPTEIEKSLRENFLPLEELSLYVNVLYLDTGDRKILIDTGSGNTGQGAVGQLIANLNTGGVKAEDIDTVIITHAHPDHIGGIINSQGEFNFPNARYYLTENEWNFWTASTVEMPDSLLDRESQQQMITAAQSALRAIGDSITLIQPGDEVISGIKAVDVSGHTPGQSAYLITSEEEQLIVTGDIFYSDPLNLEHPDWKVGFDVDSAQGVATRQRMLEQFNSDRTLLLVPHMPFPGFGHVKTENEHYQWQPIQWQFEPA